MNLGKINLITPPDKLFNLNMSYLIVKPSVHVNQQFQIASSSFILQNLRNETPQLHFL